MKVNTEVWQCKDLSLTIDDLNIRAVLLDADDAVHQQKLFDSSAPADEKTLHLHPGRVIDISRMRGQLIGMKKNQFSYIGRKTELYRVIKKLSSMSHPRPMVHIRGSEHVGKTRFVQEVCYYFFCHNEFHYIIMFKDLSEIDSYQGFKDFMRMLNKQIDSRQQGDCENLMARSSLDNRS